MSQEISLCKCDKFPVLKRLFIIISNTIYIEFSNLNTLVLYVDMANIIISTYIKALISKTNYN